LYRFQRGRGEYLAFIGRIAPEKRVDRAIEIAKRAGLPLKIAAKVDDVDREYYESLVKPLLDDPRIQYLGEIGDGEKEEFLGGARALLFPIDWPEPFGLVMVEAMACGTPVIAFHGGSVPEIIDEGQTGFIVNDLDEAVAAVHRVGDLSRRHCRDVFEQRFTATRMACDYLELYSALLEERQQRRTGVAG
jgi:glycosyltransferase involved in cell wall biosynthesis